MTVQPSPWRISFVSGPADSWASLSSRPCLPYWRRIHEQQGPLAPRALSRFLATTSPSATVSSSADFPVETGYTTYPAPPISRWDEDGFSSCSAHPCHRAAPTTPPERIDTSVRVRRSMMPSPHPRQLGLRSYFFSGPPMGSLALRPGDSLTIPRMALSVGFRAFGFPPVCDSSYRAPDSCPGGTIPR